MSEFSENTGQSGPDLTHYNELKQQAIAQTNEVKRVVADRFVPLLYAELIKQLLSPPQAASLIYKDFVPMWAYDTVRDLLPPETKDQSKAIGGRKSAEVRKEKQMNEVKYWILGNHFIFGKITEAFAASSDGTFRIGLNAKHGFLTAVPVTPKSVTTEPITVKTVSSAPVRSTT